MEIVGERDQRLGWLRKALHDYVDFLYHTLIMRVYVSHPSAMYRREPVLALGGYDETTAPAEDKDLWRKLALERWDARIVPEPLVVYRLHPGQLSQTQAAHQREVDGLSQDRFLAALAPQTPPTPVRLLLASDPRTWQHDPRRQLDGLEAVLGGARTILRLGDDEARRLELRVAARLLAVARTRPWHPAARVLGAYALARLPAESKRRARASYAAALATTPLLAALRRSGRLVADRADAVPVLRGLRGPALAPRAQPLRQAARHRMNADIEDVRRRRDEVVARHGAWTAHNVRLADGVYTIGPEPSGDEVKLRRVTQLALDAFGGSLHGVRVLDLACLEGMYALELARRGAEVVAVEGREANLAKARFAADVLGLDVDFRLEDVRHVDRERHGDFDLVLALGILYHLDAPDLLALVENLGELCRRALIVDSAVARAATETIAHDGRAYRAERLVEHEPGSTAEQRLQAVWSSLDNLTAVALTRPSLETLLAANGFTSVLECHVPAEPAKEVNRVTLLALKGEPAGTLVSATPAADPAAVPERPPLGRRLEGGAAWRLGGRLLPPAVRARLRRALGAETRRH